MYTKMRVDIVQTELNCSRPETLYVQGDPIYLTAVTKRKYSYNESNLHIYNRQLHSEASKSFNLVSHFRDHAQHTSQPPRPTANHPNASHSQQAF